MRGKLYSQKVLARCGIAKLVAYEMRGAGLPRLSMGLIDWVVSGFFSQSQLMNKPEKFRLYATLGMDGKNYTTVSWQKTRKRVRTSFTVKYGNNTRMGAFIYIFSSTEIYKKNGSKIMRVNVEWVIRRRQDKSGIADKLLDIWLNIPSKTPPSQGIMLIGLKAYGVSKQAKNGLNCLIFKRTPCWAGL